jgi:phage/plasmid-associated DNA primase
MRDHIRKVLAFDDDKSETYILNWLSWAVQHPDEPAEVALVFRGKRGTGKGTIGNAMCRVFGQHAIHISSADHLAGRFNAHLRDACFLFADEAYWPGDKRAEGNLKRLITEPELFIEAKRKDCVTVRNMLHAMMASNENWIIPAGESERRYAVYDVCESHMQEEGWFGPLYK